MRYRLKHLEIASFRGARDRVRVSLDKPLVVIYAPNGAGKSTLTTAIEWALFPKEAQLLKEHGIRERTDWEPRHIHGDDDPYVRLTLSNGGEELVIDHEGSKEKKKGRKSPDPRTSLKCTYADFKGLAYIHQETIRGFLVGEPKPREEAFQRLLGAGWIQDLAQAIVAAARGMRCEEVDQRVGRLNEQIDAQMKEAHRSVEEKESTVRQDGLTEPWNSAAQDQIGNVERAVKAIYHQFGIEGPSLPEAEPLKDYSKRLRPLLQDLRGQGPAEAHTKLSTRKTKLEGARASYKTAHDKVNKKREDLKTTQQELGTNQEVTQEIAGLTDQRDGLQTMLDNLNREASVMRAALKYFKESADAKACPACLREGIPVDLVDRLQQRLEAESTAQEKKVQQELEDVGKKLRSANDHLKKLNTSAGELQDAESHLSNQHKGLETALARPLREDESPLQVAEAEMERLNTEIGDLSQAVKELQNTVTGIENIAKKADEIGEILFSLQRVQSLGQIRQTSEWQKMTEAQQTVARREQAFKLISHAIKQLAARLAQHALQRARQPITKIYRELTQRADFPNISIDAEKKYAIEVSGDTGLQGITAILNQTDLDALAIAVVAGMATTFPEVHDLDFLILDDPSQGMDPEVTARLGQVVGSVSGQIQVVVATPDPILFQALKKSTRAKKLIQLKPRDTKSPAPFMQLECISDD